MIWVLKKRKKKKKKKKTEINKLSTASDASVDNLVKIINKTVTNSNGVKLRKSKRSAKSNSSLSSLY